MAGTGGNLPITGDAFRQTPSMPDESQPLLPFMPAFAKTPDLPVQSVPIIGNMVVARPDQAMPSSNLDSCHSIPCTGPVPRDFVAGDFVFSVNPLPYESASAATAFRDYSAKCTKVCLDDILRTLDSVRRGGPTEDMHIDRCCPRLFKRMPLTQAHKERMMPFSPEYTTAGAPAEVFKQNVLCYNTGNLESPWVPLVPYVYDFQASLQVLRIFTTALSYQGVTPWSTPDNKQTRPLWTATGQNTGTQIRTVACLGQADQRVREYWAGRGKIGTRRYLIVHFGCTYPNLPSRMVFHENRPLFTAEIATTLAQIYIDNEDFAGEMADVVEHITREHDISFARLHDNIVSNGVWVTPYASSRYNHPSEDPCFASVFRPANLPVGVLYIGETRTGTAVDKHYGAPGYYSDKNSPVLCDTTFQAPSYYKPTHMGSGPANAPNDLAVGRQNQYEKSGWQFIL